MSAIITPHHLRAADKGSMQTALAALGINWDGEAQNLLAELENHQVEVLFLDTWPQETNEDTGEVTNYPGYHANAVSRGPEPFNFGALDITVENPKVEWGGLSSTVTLA